MSNFSPERWRELKMLAARLQAVKNLLAIFEEQIDSQPFAEELKHIEKQLQADFEQTLQALIELLEPENGL